MWERARFSSVFLLYTSSQTQGVSHLTSSDLSQSYDHPHRTLWCNYLQCGESTPDKIMTSSGLGHRICYPRTPKFYQELLQTEVMFILPMAARKQSHCKQSSRCLFPTWVGKSSPVGREVWLMLCLEITQGLAKYMYASVLVYLKQTSLPAALDLSLEGFTFQISSHLS